MTTLNDCFLHDKDRLRHDDAIQLIKDRVICHKSSETVELINSLGRVLSNDIYAPINVPYSTNSAVDGYAFNHASLNQSNSLQVTGRIAAGDPADLILNEGEAVRIFTGAVIPTTADTVVMQEDVYLLGDNKIKIPQKIKRNANCRVAGEDIQKSQLVFKKGTQLKNVDVAQIASMGIGQVDIFKKLKISLFTTGNEIIEPGTPLKKGNVYNANAYLIEGFLNSPLVDLRHQGHLQDNPIEVLENLRKASTNSDLIITVGGASKGEEDHIISTLDKIGTRHMWQLAVKPGRPMAMGQINNSYFIGLPGNPVAASVCFMLYVRQIIRQLCGVIWEAPLSYLIPADFSIKTKKPDRREYLRGSLLIKEEQRVLDRFQQDGSGLISSLRQSNGLIAVPESIEAVQKGDLLEYIPYSNLSL